MIPPRRNSRLTQDLRSCQSRKAESRSQALRSPPLAATDAMKEVPRTHRPKRLSGSCMYQYHGAKKNVSGNCAKPDRFEPQGCRTSEVLAQPKSAEVDKHMNAARGDRTAVFGDLRSKDSQTILTVSIGTEFFPPDCLPAERLGLAPVRERRTRASGCSPIVF